MNRMNHYDSYNSTQNDKAIFYVQCMQCDIFHNLVSIQDVFHFSRVKDARMNGS